jgi:hypothetical protein
MNASRATEAETARAAEAKVARSQTVGLCNIVCSMEEPEVRVEFGDNMGSRPDP